MLKITWLGQSRYLFEPQDFKIIIDSYLSNSVEKVDSTKKRRMVINEECLNISVDVILITLPCST